MRCFYHASAEAVAICKNCHRGLCPECAAEVPNGLACRGRCEPEALALDGIIQRSKTTYARAGTLVGGASVAYFAFGGVFTIWGLLNLEGGGGLFHLIMGILFLFLGIVQRSRGRRFAREIQPGKPSA